MSQPKTKPDATPEAPVQHVLPENRGNAPKPNLKLTTAEPSPIVYPLILSMSEIFHPSRENDRLVFKIPGHLADRARKHDLVQRGVLVEAA